MVRGKELWKVYESRRDENGGRGQLEEMEHKEIKRASLPTSITAKMIATTPMAISTVLTLSSRRERQPYSRKVE